MVRTIHRDKLPVLGQQEGVAIELVHMPTEACGQIAKLTGHCQRIAVHQINSRWLVLEVSRSTVVLSCKTPAAGRSAALDVCLLQAAADSAVTVLQITPRLVHEVAGSATDAELLLSQVCWSMEGIMELQLQHSPRQRSFAEEAAKRGVVQGAALPLLLVVCSARVE